MTFKVDEICEIIKTCGQSGVAEFSCKGLTLIFKEAPSYLVPDIEPLDIPHTISKKAESQAREALVKDDIAMANHELDQLVIEDPDKYFELQRLGDLVNENQS
jgi:hypothetical protein